MRRLVLLAVLPVAAVGIALARGKKAGEEPPPDPVAVEVAAEVAPAPTVAAPPAPKLFDAPLPVVLPTLPAGLSSLSAQSCNACHYAAHDTWATSAHANAWASPTYQAALHSAGSSTTCVQCHLPIAAQHDTLAAGYIEGDLTRPRLEPNASFDVTLRSEGVTCAACHVRGDTVIGTRAAPNAPHPVAVSAELSSPEMCATCHQLSWPEGDKPFYDTFGEWQASAWSKAGVTCQDCHMAPTSGAIVPGTDGTLPSHLLSADASRAITTLVTLPAASVQRGQDVTVGLTLQNTGAGHSFPTGNPFKIAQIEVVFVDSLGKDMGTPWAVPFARTVEATPPYKTTADNRIAAGGQWSGTHVLNPSVKGAAGMGLLEVRLVEGTRKTTLRRVPVDVR